MRGDFFDKKQLEYENWVMSPKFWVLGLFVLGPRFQFLGPGSHILDAGFWDLVPGPSFRVLGAWVLILDYALSCSEKFENVTGKHRWQGLSDF